MLGHNITDRKPLEKRKKIFSEKIVFLDSAIEKMQADKEIADKVAKALADVLYCSGLPYQFSPRLVQFDIRCTRMDMADEFNAMDKDAVWFPASLRKRSALPNGNNAVCTII